MLDIRSNIYMVLFLSEECKSDGKRRKAFPTSQNRVPHYETLLEMFVRQNYPELLTFSDRHGCDFQISATFETSAVLLRIRDDETLALLRLTFENDCTKIVNFEKYRERKRTAYSEMIAAREREEYERIKRRYFELKAILEPEE
jgi:hypothetical protein